MTLARPAFPSLLLFSLAFSVSLGEPAPGKEEGEKGEASGQGSAFMIEVLGYTKAEIEAISAKGEQRVVHFSNLLPVEKRDFLQHKSMGKTLVLKGSFIEGYYRLLEADSIFSDDPEVKSLIGMVFLELRLFSKAEPLYKKSMNALPLNLGFRYNYAETLFVQQKYELALKHFKLVRQITKNKSSQLYSMCTLKLQLCHLGMSKYLQGNESAQAIIDYKEELAKGKSSIYSPAYYYSHVVESLRQENIDQANVWREYAQYVFPNEETHKPFIDALVEFGYLSSYYGAKAEQVSKLP